MTNSYFYIQKAKEKEKKSISMTSRLNSLHAQANLLLGLDQDQKDGNHSGGFSQSLSALSFLGYSRLTKRRATLHL